MFTGRPITSPLRHSMENLHLASFSVHDKDFEKPWEGFTTSWGMKLDCSYNACNWVSMFLMTSGWITRAHSRHLHLTWEAQLTAWLVSWGHQVSAFYPSSGNQPYLLAGVLLWLFPPALPDMEHSGLGSSTNESNLLWNTLSEQTYQICLGSSQVSAIPRECQNTLTWGFREMPNKSKFLLIHRFYCKGQLRLWIQPLYSSCNLGSLVVQHTCIEERLGK